MLALDRVDLTVHPGEVHVLLGENGAGKSTLVALLSGLRAPDGGEIRIAGRPVRPASPGHARRLGIATVFQHPRLVPTLTVAENLALDGPWWRPIDRAKTAAAIGAVGARYGLALPAEARAGDLTPDQRQQVEIARALSRGSRILLLDEPAAATPDAAASLARLTGRLAADGLAVLFITHKLADARQAGDRFTVLRAGRRVDHIAPADARALDPAALEARLIAAMFGGADAAQPTGQAPRAPASPRPVLEVDGLSVSGAGRRDRIDPVTFTLGAGEILGIAGIDGNGQAPLAEAVAGQRPATGGRLRLDGVDITGLGVAGRHRRGVRCISDDRLAEGAVGAFPIALNAVLKAIGRPPWWRGGIDRPAAIRARGRALIAAYAIRAPGPDTPVDRLSGGNIQRLLLARELDSAVRVLVCHKPTHGLDVLSAADFRRRLRAAAGNGVGVLLISGDLDEVLALADRIAVLVAGRIVATVANGADARTRIGRLMAGTP